MESVFQPKQPFITVVLPVYNRQDTLGTAIESMLKQTFTDFELLILNDGSDDQSAAIINDYASRDRRIRAFHFAKHRGLVACLNDSLNLGRGHWHTRIDDDDWSPPHRLETQYQFIQSNPDINLFGSSIVQCDEVLRPLTLVGYPTDEAMIRLMSLWRRPISGNPSMYQPQIIKKLGGFGCAEQGQEDLRLTYKAMRLITLGNIKDPLVCYRHGHGHVSRSNAGRVNDHAVLKDYKALLHCLAWTGGKGSFSASMIETVWAYMDPKRGHEPMDKPSCVSFLDMIVTGHYMLQVMQRMVPERQAVHSRLMAQTVLHLGEQARFHSWSWLNGLFTVCYGLIFWPMVFINRVYTRFVSEEGLINTDLSSLPESLLPFGYDMNGSGDSAQQHSVLAQPTLPVKDEGLLDAV